MRSPNRTSTTLCRGSISVCAAFALCLSLGAGAAEPPGAIEGGYNLPNGWRITPVGAVVPTEDLPLNIIPTPDGRAMISVQGGFNPHGLVVIDTATNKDLQRISLPTAWLGMVWAPDGKTLYVSGGNDRKDKRAPVYEFEYKSGRLSDEPISTLMETIEPGQIYWSGLAHHPAKNILFAANRIAGNIVVFDTKSGSITTRIRTEINPYELALTPDGKTLYCSNWASDSVSVIDTESCKVTATIRVGDNPNDIALAKDGRLFVACANDNSVVVVDTEKGRAVETIKTTLTARAPEGATPNALALDPEQKTLYVANGDNNDVCVIDVREKGDSDVLGFIPAGWYPSAVAVSPDGKKLYIGNAKGIASRADIHGPHSPLPPDPNDDFTVKSGTKGAITIVDVAKARRDLKELTKKVIANSPYNDDLLAQAQPSSTPSVIPRAVGAGSPIKHVIYIIKENRTYDQVFGDLKQGNGDPRLTIFGRDVSPNHHAIAEQFVLLDNLYCDAEVSVDGHQWSNAAYATDFIEKEWPPDYGGKSGSPRDTEAVVPASGYIWDQCAKKGLTFRSYGEQARRSSETGAIEAMSMRRTTTTPIPRSACQTSS
ncbi:MAG: bifunctional YncE family protein/alkaline phosphatase family protein [Candidatus Hydrogenedentes bacterium]|nr:bifunctional YncE family protein/alkaline phosphatase family protein [Candidatus Hydrogenedentota bacterium]